MKLQQRRGEKKETKIIGVISRKNGAIRDFPLNQRRKFLQLEVEKVRRLQNMFVTSPPRKSTTPFSSICGSSYYFSKYLAKFLLTLE